eukprot:6333791-Amphidinium_carterae.1
MLLGEPETQSAVLLKKQEKATSSSGVPFAAVVLAVTSGGGRAAVAWGKSIALEELREIKRNDIEAEVLLGKGMFAVYKGWWKQSASSSSRWTLTASTCKIPENAAPAESHQVHRTKGLLIDVVLLLRWFACAVSEDWTI